MAMVLDNGRTELLRDTATDRHSRDYRSLMTHSGNESLLAMTKEQLGSWLRTKKNWDINLSHDGHYTRNGREFSIRHHQAGIQQSFRARMSEFRNDHTGTWTTDLIVTRNNTGAGWVSLEVCNSSGHWVDVPGLAKYLTGALPLRDGSLTFGPEPQLFNTTRVTELEEILIDPSRQGIVFVAGSHMDLEFEPWRRDVARWTSQVLGLAQVVILDPAATARFATSFGRLAVPPGAIRTFLPHIDPEIAADGRRHRILETGLARFSDTRVRRLLGSIARQHAATRPVISELIKLRRTFERLENKAIVATLDVSTSRDIPAQAAAPTNETVDTPDLRTELSDNSLDASVDEHSALNMVKRVLEIPEITEDALRSIVAQARRQVVSTAAITRAAHRLEVKQEQIEQLEDELRSIQLAWDDEKIEHATTAEEREQISDENRWLRSRLREQGDFDAAFGETPEDEKTTYPSTFYEVIERVGALTAQGVVFTGNSAQAEDLSAIDELGKSAHEAWDVLLMLVDYIRARNEGACDNGVDHYLKHGPSGYRRISPGKHAYTETSRTMSGWGDERVFPVPSEVDQSGLAVMRAHCRLGSIGMISPRLYYLDDWHRSGRVYVGYIGRHLTNTQTN